MVTVDLENKINATTASSIKKTPPFGNFISN